MLFLDFLIILLVPQVLSQDAIGPLIVGGRETTIEEHPYQVAIRVRLFVMLQEFCGGFIVSENYILTSAYCIYGFVTTPGNIEVRAGSTFRAAGTVIIIEEFRVHPEYDTNIFSVYDKDIACLRTSSPIQFSDTIQPVGLPSVNRTLTGNVTVTGWARNQVARDGTKFHSINLVVYIVGCMPVDLPPVNRTLTGNVTETGWGRTQENNTQLSRILMAVNLPVVNRSVCENVYGRRFTNNMWCSGDYEEGGVTSCMGDSGGPAVQGGLAVGIASFGRSCGGVGEPVVFTDLAAPSIRNFISDYTGL